MNSCNSCLKYHTMVTIPKVISALLLCFPSMYWVQTTCTCRMDHWLVNDIVEALLPKQAPQIGSIPKDFFINACCGKRVLSNKAVVVSQHSSIGGKVQEILQRGASDETLHVPPKRNFLVTYSTMPEYQSSEVKGKGGVWMTSLAKRLCTSSDSVQDILSEVNKDLMQKF